MLETVFGHRHDKERAEAANKEAKWRRKEKELICVFPDKEDIVGDLELELLMMNGYGWPFFAALHMPLLMRLFVQNLG